VGRLGFRPADHRKREETVSMKRVVTRFGLISGAIAAVLLLARVPSMDGGTGALVFGYAAIVLALLLVFFGVRSYRETVGGGRLSFGRGLSVGLLIAIISSACYVATWEVVYFRSPEVADHVFERQIVELEASGAPPEELAKARVEVDDWKRLYANPLVNIALTLCEPLPVGILMALISAAILRRK
jgi:hypothetical protein